jgi:glycosyltransferase involved in cell wall biosynthesis
MKLRIAFATPEYVTESYFDGGLAHYVNRVSQTLVSLGHEVHVITLSVKDDDAFDHGGVRVHRVMLGPVWHTLNRATRCSFATTLHWLNFSTQIYRKLKELHSENPFHLIQYPNYSFCGLFSIPLLRAAHVVRASTFEPSWNHAQGVKRNFDSVAAQRLEALQYRLTQNIHVPSSAVQKMLAEKTNVSDARLIRTPFYLETSEWDDRVYEQFFKGKKYALYFGRFQLHKGFHRLAQALPRFLNECADAHIALVGRDMETSLAPSMARFARAQCGRAAERLIVVENLPHSQLYPVIAGAHLVVLPSLVDNSPNACLEAMGLGKVVIGTYGASFDELIVDRVNGFLVSPDSPDALAEKMISAWTDPDLSRIAEAAKQRMLEFAPEKTVASLLSYYSEVIAR